MRGFGLGMATLAVVFAFSAPSAGANWHHEGQPIAAGKNPQATLVGTFATNGMFGGLHCANLSTTIELTGGTTDGHIRAIPNMLFSCSVTGSLVFLCGGTGLTSVVIDGLPTLTAEGDNIRLSNYAPTFRCKSGFEFGYSTTGAGLTMIPNNPSAMETLTVEGKLDQSPGEEEATVTGAFTFSGAAKGTYGVTK